jgi:predicted transcriptional regulator
MNPALHPFRKPAQQIGPLEQRLLETLWEKGSATVRELLESGYRHLAYTTVMTTLDRLFKKNLLLREPDGRAFRYSPRLSRERLRQETAGEVLHQFLDASPGSALPLSFLVVIVGERDSQLLDQLRELVENKRRELAKKDAAKKDLPKKANS